MRPDVAHAYVQQIRRIPGWFWPGAAYMLALLDEVQRRMGARGNIFEIGAYHGRSAILLAGLLDRERELLGVCDTFALHDPDTPAYREDFLANMSQFFPTHAFLRVFARTSRELTIEDTTDDCRLFHIDGGHESETVLHDLELADRALRADGLAILDDAYNFSWPGVLEGTFGFMARHRGRFAPLLIGFNKMVLCRPERHSRYRELLHGGVNCWEYVPRGPYSLRSMPLHGVQVDVFHAPSRRSPDPLRTVLTTIHKHSPRWSERLARWSGYRRPPEPAIASSANSQPTRA